MQSVASSGVEVLRIMGELFDLRRADTLGKDPSCFYYVEQIERMREMVRELVANHEAYSIKTLDLTGGDLIAAGMKPGPQVGAALNRALEATICGNVPNNRVALLSYLRD